LREAGQGADERGPNDRVDNGRGVGKPLHNRHPQPEILSLGKGRKGLDQRRKKLKQGIFNAAPLLQRKELLEELGDLKGVGGCGMFRDLERGKQPLKVKKCSGEGGERDLCDDDIPLPFAFGDLLRKCAQLVFEAAIAGHRFDRIKQSHARSPTGERGARAQAQLLPAHARCAPGPRHWQKQQTFCGSLPLCREDRGNCAP
jgi:hypothetical protein